MNKKAILIITFVIFAITGFGYLFFLDISQAANKKDKVAMGGYDPVSYFTEKQPIKGKKQFQWDWNKTRWRFETQKNLELFKANPAEYAPQFGGNCAFTTSLGKAQRGLPKHWEIRDNKLYFNANIISHFLWKAFPARLEMANENWKILTSNKVSN